MEPAKRLSCKGYQMLINLVSTGTVVPYLTSNKRRPWVTGGNFENIFNNVNKIMVEENVVAEVSEEI
jgi:hypothetical protein